jgi:hypothetical protein
LSKIRLNPADATPSRPADAAQPTQQAGLQLVRILYEAVEEDWFSADDQIREEATGLVYEDGEGRVLILTARSACDAAFTVRDAFGGDPEIASEGISVQLADGSVLRALRTWVAPDGADLTVLVADLEPGQRADVALSSPRILDFAADPGSVDDLDLRAMDGDRRVIELEHPAAALPELSLSLGAVALRDGRVVGVVGQRAADSSEPALLSLGLVPEGLRPRQ